MKKIVAVLACFAAGLLLVPNLFAQVGPPCSGLGTPVFYGLDSYIVCDNSKGPTTGFSWMYANPAINSGTLRITSDRAANQVLAQFDWTTPGVTGCPKDASGTNQRILVSVACNDGKGVLLSGTGQDLNAGQYLMELSHKFDPVTLAAPAVAWPNNGRPMVTNLTTTSVSVHVDPLQVYSDCDPDSTGINAGSTSCTDNLTGAALAPRVAQFYSRVDECGTGPTTSRSQWTAVATPDASGNATIPYTKPTGLSPAGNPLCLFIGSSIRGANGLESTGIAGFIQVAGVLAASPVAENVRASVASGKVALHWSVSTDLGLAGFRFQTETKAKGVFEVGSLVSADQVRIVDGVRTYDTAIRMGDFQGGKKVRVISVLTDDTTPLASDWVSF